MTLTRSAGPEVITMFVGMQFAMLTVAPEPGAENGVVKAGMVILMLAVAKRVSSCGWNEGERSGSSKTASLTRLDEPAAVSTPASRRWQSRAAKTVADSTLAAEAGSTVHAAPCPSARRPVQFPCLSASEVNASA